MNGLTRVAPERTVTPTVLSASLPLGDQVNGDTMTRKGARAHNRLDLTGQTYNLLTVTAWDEERKRWRCSCACGNTHYVTTGALRSGNTRSCGCLKHTVWDRHQHSQTGATSWQRSDITGQTFNRLTALRYLRTKKNLAIWEARCSCGNVVTVSAKALKSGNTKSCGCLRHDAARIRGKALKGAVRADYRQKSLSRIGDRFGKLVVKDVYWRDFDAGYRVAMAKCDCDCGTKTETRLPDLVDGKTVSCGCGTFVSAPETQLAEFVSRLTPVKTQFVLSGWSYDIAVPAKKLLIEFNGLYWHSYPRKQRGAHYAKRRDAEANGYRLITIWEDDWAHKRERMESLLRRALFGPDLKIGARQTEVVRIPRVQARAFHEEHHVQDFTMAVANQHYALFDQADLVAVASFDRKGVLHRYTVLEGLSIAGGLQKCIKAFRGDFGALPIITYCDRDHFTGDLYRAAGFRADGGSMTMSYVTAGRRVRREGYMKHKLPSLFGDVDLRRKEIDICAEHGVYACWNSGTEKYIHE